MNTAETNTALKGTYCNSLTEYSRFLTREVSIGNIPVGGKNPIRIQSMTTTDTMDTIATVEQTIRMVDAGCEYVRITAPSIKEALNLAEIKKELKYRGYDVPLIADIHFTPNAAEAAARIVEKVRINPGNYADKKRFDQLEYTPAEYEAELGRIYQKFAPLVKVCKEYGTAMRIGTNHGSLSDRIMSYYGDTPRGMVESAMEFIRMCESLSYYNLVISMKASNPQVMVQAYRLLVETMQKEGMNYPLHLGVTEAGDGEDGRIKSSVGIGTLLEDGLGDTIRVSLTEDPELEAPVAIALAKRYEERPSLSVGPDISLPAGFSPYSYQKRESAELNTFIGGHQVPRVVLDISYSNLRDPQVLSAAGYEYSALLDKYNMAEQSVDFVYLADELPSFTMPGNLKQAYNYPTWLKLANKKNCHPVFTLHEYKEAGEKDLSLNLVRITNEDLHNGFFSEDLIDQTLVLVLETSKGHGMADQRQFFFSLMKAGINVPVIVRRGYSEGSESDFQLYAATDAGALLIDGFGDGIWLDAPHISPKAVVSTAFGILQATRSRISKTEYISCPSCGRTLFDLQETTQMIRSRTSHLKGVKIGIMGCIVNGPGEMADADYGYVGTGPGKITLYRGKQVVKKAVNTENALDELIEIIKEDGNWREVDS
ncbi:4-hydroxy-3-methylbut-2-en-1-yl diphosphate synthase [Arcticibacter tournemirensis]|uniref:4-hydroxy-3-methylbut-2-en-1-yl diphosphate synthase (flavodoxin) n=1 Tax=Arcticibacter tournemirensis TaxID=699437 RepID=A0A5M9HIP4_9SPHI|nr:(E)-4-hydroxy-3-methylbut-2-enyl-diphosphate synthase [Arcticibacter tournemirensis]KAA8485258.1 (E)-4-hydroxy-3-methylbut-2-enyl-diphosphate synthase [Arcticibacter tournemirensis]TQM50458.1 4-hydroxy-3-methylbut-2-en-1-yl diphosphate synthase [Arcticibacter tournemirensis]